MNDPVNLDGIWMGRQVPRLRPYLAKEKKYDDDTNA